MLRLLAALATIGSLAGGSVLAQSGPTTADLSLWLKADSGLAADGSTWTDQSGNGHDATAVAGQAPAVISGGLNGLPVAQFNGAQRMTIAGTVVGKQRFTILAVVTDTSVNGGGFREIISNWSGLTSTKSIFLGTIWSTVGGVTADRIRFTDAVGGQSQGQTGQGDIKTPTKAFILSGVAGGHNTIIRVGRKVQYQLGAAIPRRNLTALWYLGDQGDSNVEHWEGDIAEVLVYNDVLSKAELATDLAYLQAKWQTTLR